jgi:DNA-directed RNA polymerase subunit L
MILDKQRLFIPNSFDFIIQTIGVYNNVEIVKFACNILKNKFDDLIVKVESDSVPIINNETTMDYSFDIILENEDYTVGKVIECILYDNYYYGNKLLSFCGFKKMHPHDSDSIIRIAFNNKSEKSDAKTILKQVCETASSIYKSIDDKF